MTESGIEVMTRKYFFLALWTFVVGGFVTGLIVVFSALTVDILVRRNANKAAHPLGGAHGDITGHRVVSVVEGQPQPI
jgi:hypothetical protein